MTGTFESRKPDECPWCVDAWGVHVCALSCAPCVRVIKCPEGRDVIQMIDAQTYLRQAAICNAKVNSLLEEVQRLKELTRQITATLKPDVVSHSGNQDKLGNMIAKIVDLENEINAAVDEYVDKRREIITTIEKINVPDQVSVLYKLYLEEKTWPKIAEEMHMTERNAQYIHGRALQSVRRVLGGEAE